MNRDLGRHAYGLAAIVFGATALMWRDVHAWPQVKAYGQAPFLEAIFYVAAVIAIAAGIAMQWRPTAQPGAVAVGTIYLLFAILWIPGIVRAPSIYNNWGNFFEQFSIFSGALIVYASSGPGRPPWAARAARIGQIFFGLSVVSFALEQAFYLQPTADLVPTWLPPGQMFWAVATTIALALAAVSILFGFQTLLATRLLTAMLLLFLFLIWIPSLFTDPRRHANWSESGVTLAIAGVAWILAGYLGSESPKSSAT